MKFSDIIVCDDIRNEMGGKHTLVGVYADKIVFNTGHNESPWPLPKQLGIYVRLIKEEDDPEFTGFNMKIFLELSKESQPSQLINVDGVFKGSLSNPVILNFVVPVNFPGPGPLKLKLNFATKDNGIVGLSSDLLEVTSRPK
jgi:hypothetical protein